jgi:hypothetical protein
MVKTLDESLNVSEDFSGFLGETLSKGEQVDDSVQDYLDENPEGLSFSYKDKEYILAKDQADGKVKLYQVVDGDLILKDPEVQINSKFTPDGMIEIGGLVSPGSRVYITRSTQNPSEIIAFASEDTDSVSIDHENAVVIYSNDVSDAPPENQSGLTSPELPPSSNNNYNLDGYVSMPDLEDGNYTSQGGLLFDSEGNSLGKQDWYPDGSYKVVDGRLYKESVTNGSVIFLPISSYGYFFETGSYINEQGSVEGEVTIQLLTDLGVPARSLPITHCYNIHFDDINGSFSVESYQGSDQVGLIITGTGDNRTIVGSTYLSPGTYMALTDEVTNTKTIYHEYTKMEEIDGTKNSVTYLLPYDVILNQFLFDQNVFALVGGKWVESPPPPDFYQSIS